MSKSAFVTQDVVRIPIGTANAYIIGYAREWILVDTGTPGNADKILKDERCQIILKKAEVTS